VEIAGRKKGLLRWSGANDGASQKGTKQIRGKEGQRKTPVGKSETKGKVAVPLAETGNPDKGKSVEESVIGKYRRFYETGVPSSEKLQRGGSRLPKAQKNLRLLRGGAKPARKLEGVLGKTPCREKKGRDSRKCLRRRWAETADMKRSACISPSFCVGADTGLKRCREREEASNEFLGGEEGGLLNFGRESGWGLNLAASGKVRKEGLNRRTEHSSMGLGRIPVWAKGLVQGATLYSRKSRKHTCIITMREKPTKESLAN